MAGSSGTMRRRRAVIAAGLAAGMLIAAEAAESLLARFLTRLEFSRSDLRDLAGGVAVIRTLETSVRQEIAHVGIVRVGVSPERFLDAFRDIERFESGPAIPKIGRFSQPPRLSDLAGLSLPAEDFEALRRCAPGDCKVKLSAEAIRRFQTEVDWDAPDAAARADALTRVLMLGLVREYQAVGNEGLGHYDDRSEPLPVAREFSALLDSEIASPADVPALLDYLDDYPRGRPAATEDFFYWAIVDFGLKPTIRLNHVAIHRLDPRQAPGASHVIAIKQLYASHYFHTTLELRFLLEDERSADGQAFYLVSITLSRNDGMTGARGFFLRPIIRGRSRDAVREYLEHVKRQVERGVPATAGGR